MKKKIKLISEKKPKKGLSGSKITNGLHVWDDQWPHIVSTEADPREAHLLEDADLKYQGLYYKDLLE